MRRLTPRHDPAAIRDSGNPIGTMMLNRTTTRALLGAFALLAALGTSPVAAQNVSTTGQVRGRVVSAEGRPVSEVVVTARNRDTGLERSALTNTQGFYAIRLLPPGGYDVRTEVIGFADDVLENVRVAIGQTSTANFVLETQAVEVEGIEVTADRERIDVSDASVTQLVTVQQIEELPALGRDFTDFVELSGLVAPDPGATTGGQFAIAGQRPSGTNLQIDGVDANNSFFGENRGGSRIPFVFSLESIQEFQVITNGFDVEYGNYSGGIVNVVTRGGTNDFEGTVYGNFRSDALTGKPFVSGDEVDNYEVEQFAGRFSGPLVRDKAHFLLSADYQRRREPQLPLTPNNQPAELQGDIQRFFQILENQYGVENAAAGYQPFETTNDALTLFGRLDWTINQNHRLSLRHNFSDYKNDREFTEYYDFEYGRSRAENLADRSNSLVAELQSVLGDNTFNVLRFQWSNEDRPRNGTDVRPTLTVRVPGIEGESASNWLRYGGTFVAFQNTLEERKYQLVDNFTHVLGEHTLKVGANALFTNVLNQFQAPMSGAAGNQSAGEFVFDNLDAFANFRPSTYLRPFQRGGGISRARFDVAEWSVYAQDEWRVTPKLTATLGLRYDQQAFRDSPTPVVDVERAFGYDTGFAPVDGDNISPRLALAYDVNADGRQVVRAGVGYFYGRVPYVLGGNVLQTQTPVVQLRCNGDIGDPDAPPSVSNYAQWSVGGFDNPTACAGGTGAATPIPTYSLWSEDFQYPEILKANVGYEGLLTDKTRLSVDVLFSEGTNQYSVRNINLRPVQFTISGEGRRVYTPLDVFSPSGGNEVNARVNTDFADVYAIYNDGRNRSFVTNLELSHNVTDDVRLSGSYTLTKAWDNVSESCCESGGIFEDPTLGAYGPNDLGGVGDFARAWGRSDFARDHTFILSGFATLPYEFQVSAFWRIQSGRPWTPEVSGDLNGDGVLYNDRPFVFSPENLPLLATGDQASEQREIYRQVLADNSCVGDYEGQFIDRNTCEYPWTNRLDMKITKTIETFTGQRAELQVDLFNVVNGIGQVFCSAEERAAHPTEGACGWGRVTGIFGADRNLLRVAGFDPGSKQILYSLPYASAEEFAQEDVLGSNLLLQFQAQLGLRYYF